MLDSYALGIPAIDILPPPHPTLCRKIDDEYARQAAELRHTYLLDPNFLRRLPMSQFFAISRTHPLEVWFSLIDSGLGQFSRAHMPEDSQITISARYAGVDRDLFLGLPHGEGLTAVNHLLFAALNAFDHRRPTQETSSKIWRYALEQGDLAAAVEFYTGQPVQQVN